MAEVAFYLKGLIDLPEAEELPAFVIGQGMPICSYKKAAFAFHSHQAIA